MIELTGYTNKIFDLEFLLILALLGLISLFFAYCFVRYIKQRNLNEYCLYIFEVGFLLVLISQLMASLAFVLPFMIFGLILYILGIFIAFILPGLCMKNYFPNKYATILVSLPAFFMPYCFYNWQGPAGDMENYVNIMSAFEFVFDYISAVILSQIILGLILLVVFAFRRENREKNTFLPFSVLLLIIMAFFSSLIVGAIFLSVYLYIFFKETGIKTSPRNIFLLIGAACGLLIAMLILINTGMGSVNTCIYNLLGTLSISLTILGLVYFMNITSEKYDLSV